MARLERPAPVAVALRRDQLDCFGHAFVGRDAGAAQVVEPAQHVVVPPRREGEARPRGAALAIARDYLAGRTPPEEPSLEEILLAADVLAEVRADRRDLPVDARLDFACKEGIAVTFLWPASPPRHPLANEAQRAACLLTRGIDTQVPQQHEDVHGGVPTTVPCHAAPAAVVRLERDQACTKTLRGHARALGCDLFCGCIGQIAQHLPAD